MNGKGVVADWQRGVENHEKRWKSRQNQVRKKHDGDNLERLNDAKCIILRSPFTQRAFEKQGKMCVLQALWLNKMLELRVTKRLFVNEKECV